MMLYLLQDLEVSLVAGFVADRTVNDLWQRGNEEKWHECNNKLECKTQEKKLSWNQLATAVFWFFKRYYAKVNISTSEHMELNPKSKMQHGKKMELLDRAVD